MKNRLFILLIMHLFFGCTDPPPQPDPTPLNPTFKEWCAFKPGTWWTYKEITTIATDSFWVSSYSEEVQEDVDGVTYWQFGMDITSANDTFGVHRFRGNPGGSDHVMWGLIEVAFIAQGSRSYGRFYYTTNPPLTLNAGISQTELDSLVLNSGEVFFNVTKVENQTPNNYNWVKSEYFAKNIGVVRREMFSGQIWEIENYNIVQ